MGSALRGHTCDVSHRCGNASGHASLDLVAPSPSVVERIRCGHASAYTCLGDSGPVFGQFAHNVGQAWPKAAGVDQIWPELDQAWANCGQHIIGGLWAVGPTLAAKLALAMGRLGYVLGATLKDRGRETGPNSEDGARPQNLAQISSKSELRDRPFELRARFPDAPCSTNFTDPPAGRPHTPKLWPSCGDGCDRIRGEFDDVVGLCSTKLGAGSSLRCWGAWS